MLCFFHSQLYMHCLSTRDRSWAVRTTCMHIVVRRVRVVASSAIFWQFPAYNSTYLTFILLQSSWRLHECHTCSKPEILCRMPSK